MESIKLKCPKCGGILNIYIYAYCEYGDSANYDEIEIECLNDKCDFEETIDK